MMKAIVHLTIYALILSGCGVSPSRTDVPERISTLQTTITAGKTSRSEIIEKLGNPFIRNENFRVEVYRVFKDSDFYYLWAPLPVPVGADEMIAYALVVYNEDSIVSDTDWGVFRSSDNNYDNLRRTATLVADGFLFESFEVWGIYPRTEVLFATEYDSRKSLLSTAPQGTCLLHIAPGEYEYKIMLDGKELASYRTDSGLFTPYSHPVHSHGWNLGFITVLIQTGDHTLSIATRGLKPSEFKKNFVCTSRDKIYAHPDIERYRWTDKWSWEGQMRYRGEIAISDIAPDVFKDRRLILFHRDRWLTSDQ